jgi:1-acyl-sn-glycerol-3-phosphate acyltransferase
VNTAAARPPYGRRGAVPSRAAIALARAALAPWRWLTAPRFFGVEHVPTDRPVVLAGNHTVMGLLDVPVMLLGLHERRRIWPRPLGDHLHFQLPGWREFLQLYGTVEGTPESCRALMRAGESILVFPGGGREVFKRKGERYRLLWATRSGFARLAIEHGYPIVPFAAVGAEECYDILVDAGDLLRFVPPLRWLPRAEEVPPLVRGLGPTLLPRPQRFYFHFGQPIETRHLMGLEGDERIVLALREQVRAAVDAGIAFLLRERERDPERALLARITAAVRGRSRTDAAKRRRKPARAAAPEPRRAAAGGTGS